MKKIVALVLAMVMVLGLATTAFAAKAGSSFTAAKDDSGNWDFVVTQDDAEEAKDSTFATYEIEAFAKKYIKSENPAWDDDAATLTDVKAGEDVTVYANGVDTFVKVDDKNADLVIIDGKTVSYFKSLNAKELKWDAKAVKVTLPGYPVDPADVKCNTYYNLVKGVPGTFYYDAAEEVMYVAEAGGKTVLNVDGVAVFATAVTAKDPATAVEEPAQANSVGFVEVKHDLVVNYAYRADKSQYATKVYCENCKAEFKFVFGLEGAALAEFGAGNYQNVEGLVWVELQVPAVPGVSAGSVVTPADKDDAVTSPKTFDAGIAMYVGMSVMAAAGSAVVLKKKD